jgi:3-phenylpropionate/trans-cinnamate dioxygenase ferredoxin reductase component
VAERGEYPERIVVVGGGLAGLRTMEELRAAGYRGGLTLIGSEARPPYDRPPLSKAFLAGAVKDTSLRGPADLDALGARIMLGERAEELGDGVLRTDLGEYPFDRLVIATGARPISLPGSGRQRFLRSFDDALELREQLVAGARLVIVGAGWIGAELATAAVAQGCQVTVVEAGVAPLAGAVGAEVGAVTVAWYEQAGIELLLGQAVTAVADGGLELAAGGWLAADVVVTAVGVRPEVGWLESAGVLLGNGVVVDDRLESSVAGVYAVGDCAAFWSGRFNRRMRPEHWDAALRAPATVAVNVLGGDERYDPVPYFWSEQFGRMLQFAGEHRGATDLVWRGDTTAASWSACWLAGNGDERGEGGAGGEASGRRLVAMLTTGRPRDFAQGRRIIEAGTLVNPGKLADTEVSVSAAAIEASPRV